MMRESFRAAAVLLPAALLVACAAGPPRTPETAECRELFAELDRRAEAAGTRDAGAFRVPGYPYLRTGRLLASFADETFDAARFDVWVERMRIRDLDSRGVELENAGITGRDALLQQADACGRRLARAELAAPRDRQRLRDAVTMPDDYSLLARTLGLYPVAVPFLNLGISDFNEDVREDYARPVPELDSPGTLVAWRPPGAPQVSQAEIARWMREAPRDALGIPQLDPEKWWILALRHAPVWWIETTGIYDRPGVPVPGDVPGLDASRPVTYFQPSYTRFGERVLPELVYVVWFSERPPEDGLDSYAGALDGVIWRVTLDPDGAPLVYDTIHSCGCYRYYFPAQPLRRVPRGGFWQEPVLFPQAEVPEGSVAVRLQTRTHYVRRVVSADEADAAVRHEYLFAPYDTLLTLPDGRGATTSLFGECGIVPGTERLERFWLWPAGVRSPGAMRQWGRHATSFVGRSHFDDARWLEQVFEIPDWARPDGS